MGKSLLRHGDFNSDNESMVAFQLCQATEQSRASQSLTNKTLKSSHSFDNKSSKCRTLSVDSIILHPPHTYNKPLLPQIELVYPFSWSRGGNLITQAETLKRKLDFFSVWVLSRRLYPPPISRASEMSPNRDELLSRILSDSGTMRFGITYQAYICCAHIGRLTTQTMEMP